MKEAGIEERSYAESIGLRVVGSGSELEWQCREPRLEEIMVEET